MKKGTDSLEYSEILVNRPDLREEAEERAGIIEYSGNYTRQEAETATAELLHKRYLIFSQGNLFNGGEY